MEKVNPKKIALTSIIECTTGFLHPEGLKAPG